MIVTDADCGSWVLPSPGSSGAHFPVRQWRVMHSLDRKYDREDMLHNYQVNVWKLKKLYWLKTTKLRSGVRALRSIFCYLTRRSCVTPCVQRWERAHACGRVCAGVALYQGGSRTESGALTCMSCRVQQHLCERAREQPRGAGGLAPGWGHPQFQHVVWLDQHQDLPEFQ